MPHDNDDRHHHYVTTVTWTGNTGEGTASYRSYERAHDIAVDGKPVIAGSSDAAFRGDPARWTPEDMLVASISTCHMLWYLHLAAQAQLIVTSYVDRAEGEMIEERSGSGHFTRVTLRPEIVLAAGSTPEQVDRARSLHHHAHTMCFVANSVNFPVATEGTITVAKD
ncbi:MAG: OsmC family protein [Thermomicrobiales bacterium]